MAKIIQLPPTGAVRTPIGHAIRTGEASYKRLENLHAEGRLPARAVIVDASKARFQKEFIRALRATGADVTLDPKVAELSEVGKFSGSARETPWAVDDNTRPLEAEDFEPGANADLFDKFARMAAELGVTSVMAPTHLLRSGVDNPGFRSTAGASGCFAPRSTAKPVGMSPSTLSTRFPTHAASTTSSMWNCVTPSAWRATSCTSTSTMAASTRPSRTGGNGSTA